MRRNQVIVEAQGRGRGEIEDHAAVERRVDRVVAPGQGDIETAVEQRCGIAIHDHVAIGEHNRAAGRAGGKKVALHAHALEHQPVEIDRPADDLAGAEIGRELCLVVAQNDDTRPRRDGPRHGNALGQHRVIIRLVERARRVVGNVGVEKGDRNRAFACSDTLGRRRGHGGARQRDRELHDRQAAQAVVDRLVIMRQRPRGGESDTGFLPLPLIDFDVAPADQRPRVARMRGADLLEVAQGVREAPVREQQQGALQPQFDRVRRQPQRFFIKRQCGVDIVEIAHHARGLLPQRRGAGVARDRVLEHVDRVAMHRLAAQQLAHADIAFRPLRRQCHRLNEQRRCFLHFVGVLARISRH